jgi:hypothetical protein
METARPTENGYKIGEAVTDKVGFYGVTPVVQPASAAQAVCTDAASVIVLANALRAALVSQGIIKGAA